MTRANVPAGVTAKELLDCVGRELNLRRRVYPGWVARGRMSQAAADDELRRMSGVLQVLEQVLPVDLDQGELFKGSGGRR